MPTVNVKRDLLFKALGKKYSDDEFRNLCFQFGIELDEVVTEKKGTNAEESLTHNTLVSEEVFYKIDIPANRYDLLCLEGIVQGLLVFLNRIDVPKHLTTGLPETCSIFATKRCLEVRPHIVAGILHDIEFTKDSYDSFIDLQEKLHQTLGRKRTLVSIGTHDLDTVQKPFTYDAKSPSEIYFRPLNQDKEYNGNEIMDLYANHAQLKQYLPIIKNSPVYPVVQDSNGIVLSLPPIINGEHSKITLNTKNVLIECTATDLSKANTALTTILCAFSQYCKVPYTIGTVYVKYQDGETFSYPNIKHRVIEVDCQKATDYIGIKQTPQELIYLLSRMSLASTVKNDNTLRVVIPPTRSDIIHACDIYEDIAIAYGYNRIEKTIPRVSTIGEEFPLNKLSDQLRLELACAGFTETLTFSLCSREDVANKLGWKLENVKAVQVANPKTIEFQVVRTTLLPGLLKALVANRKMPLPHKLFEVSDVVSKDSNMEVGARNHRHLCAVYSNKSDGFETIHGLLGRILQVLDVPWVGDKKKEGGYCLRSVNDPTFFPQRCAEILYNGNVLGKMGVLHPDVLSRFDLCTPCSALEINIEPFL